MTEYGKYATITRPAPLLSYDRVNEAKEARKKLLTEVERRRAENYKRYYARIKATKGTNPNCA